MNGSIQGTTFSLASLKALFDAMFDEFLLQSNFDKKCRLLLDLFKLQVVFAGLTYE
jgi:hypothetical protein